MTRPTESEILIERAEGTKCPRCWNYHKVRKNFMDMCDRCQLACLEGAADWVANGQLTQEEADQLVAGIKESAEQWRSQTIK